jgi:hypothetical protein
VCRSIAYTARPRTPHDRSHFVPDRRETRGLALAVVATVFVGRAMPVARAPVAAVAAGMTVART